MINSDICSKTFANKQNLFRHFRNIHNIEKLKSEQRNYMEMSYQKMFFGSNEKTRWRKT